ncbi:MAG: LysM peptidoglycan-binding domain-containing protein [Paludibacter sp.]|nr:LysM peptidoglycan-binding domain-containing protein [Paludibacter sp.]
MEKQLFRFMLAGFFLITTFTIAQNSNLPIEKKQGKDYYVYTVEVSEGLNAIGRKFNVSPDDIAKVNPEVKEGLQIGQKILIPINKKNRGNIKTENKTSQDFIQHKVERKQTLFAISRKYNVSQEEIKKLNPQIESGLHEGVILQIPIVEKDKKKRKEENEINKSQNQSINYITHTVKAKETLYSISKLYKVEIESIKALNPGSEINISIGSELKIPLPSDAINTKNAKEDFTRKSTANPIDLESIFNKKEPVVSIDTKKVIRIAFLLPFMLEQSKSDASAERFVNFYAGALLAANEAKKKGVSLEIFTYDTDKTEEKLIEVLNNPELKSMDFIIGPAFSNQVSAMGEFSKKNSINTLIPFTSKVPDIDNNPFLYQFNPGADSEMNFATELFTGKYKNMNIIFANIPDISIFDDGKIGSDMLRKNLNSIKRVSTTLELSSSEYVDFTTVLKKGSKNIIIFNTDKFAYITPYITTIKNYSNSFDITLFEQYTWKDQPENVAQRIYISPFISSFNPAELDIFNRKFSKSFNWNSSTDTPRFDLLGYDIANYFIALLNQYGTKFPIKMSAKVNANFIQSQPQFERFSPKSGFVNQQLYLTEVKNK